MSRTAEAAARLSRLYAQYGAGLLQGLATVTEQAGGFVYRLTNTLYYLPLPGEEYVYLAVQVTPEGAFMIRGPLMKEMYGPQRVFRPLRTEEHVAHPDADAKLATALHRLLEALDKSGYADAAQR